MRGRRCVGRRLDRVLACIAGVAVVVVARTDRLPQSIETEVREGVGAEKLTDLGDAVCGSDQLIAVRRVDPVIAWDTDGGQLIRMWTSRAPAALIIPTICRLVVPRTIESSTNTTR